MTSATNPGAKTALRKLRLQRESIIESIVDDRLRQRCHELLSVSGSRESGFQLVPGVTQMDLDAALGSDLAFELARINRSIELVEQGRWGECETCGQLIEADRLILDPTINRCCGCRDEFKPTQNSDNRHGYDRRVATSSGLVIDAGVNAPTVSFSLRAK